MSATRVQPTEAALQFLPDHDYADALTVSGVPDVAARTWARRSIGSTPRLAQRTFGRLVWHGVLGFDLAPVGADGTMVGWTITKDEPDLFVLNVGGTRMTGCMVFVVKDGTVTWTTAVHYLSPSAAKIWSVAQHVHRALSRRMLVRAAKTIRPHGPRAKS